MSDTDVYIYTHKRDEYEYGSTVRSNGGIESESDTSKYGH
jgi:hypothetical protein